MIGREFVSAGIEMMPAIPRARCQGLISAMIRAGWSERIVRSGQTIDASEMAEERLVRMMPDLAYRRSTPGRHRAQFDRALAQAAAVLGGEGDQGSSDLVMTASARSGKDISQSHVLLHVALICGVPILDMAHDSVAVLSAQQILDRVSDPAFLAEMIAANRQARGEDMIEIELARASVGIFAAQKKLPYNQAASRFVEAGVLAKDSPLFQQAQTVRTQAETLGRHEPARLIGEIGKALAEQQLVLDRSRLTPETAEMELRANHAARLAETVAQTGTACAADMAQIILPAEAAGANLLEQGDPRPLGAQLVALSAGLSASMAARDIAPIEVAAGPLHAAAVSPVPAPEMTASKAILAASHSRSQPTVAGPRLDCRIAREAVAKGRGFADQVAARVADGTLAATDPRAAVTAAQYGRDGYLTPEHLVCNLADAMEAQLPVDLSQRLSEPKLAASVMRARRTLASVAASIDDGAFLAEDDLHTVLDAVEGAAIHAALHAGSRPFAEATLIRLAGLVESLLRRTALAG